MDGRVDILKDGWIDIWMETWIDEWIDEGWMAKWINGTYSRIGLYPVHLVRTEQDKHEFNLHIKLDDADICLSHMKLSKP